MPKRRRERDRPKAAHDAPYNPNKRVLLSYASDEEEDQAVVEQPDCTETPIAVDAAIADYKIEEYPDDDEVEDVASDNDSLGEEAADIAVEGRTSSRKNDDTLWTRGGARRNSETGQWPALGSLSYQWEEGEEEEVEEEYDSTEEEAMQYLRAVRSERQSMPTVFKASTTDTDEEIYESGIGDTRGYVEDGAYMLRATMGPEFPEVEKTTAEPQEVFTAALKQRFLKHREQMHTPPSFEALVENFERHPTSFQPNNKKLYARWKRWLKFAAPVPSQVCALSHDTVFGLLEVIQIHHLVREKEISTNTSTWIWSLLARLDDVGTLDRSQVSAIREFGKKAVLVQVSFSDSVAAEQLEHTAAIESGADGVLAHKNVVSNEAEIPLDEDEDISAKDGEALTSVPVIKPKTVIPVNYKERQSTLATLDVIILLVGEVFRQRDLLDFRRPWKPDNE